MEQTLYDLASLEEITGGDKDFMNNMVELFLTSAPQDLKDMETAAQSKDYSTVSSIAHKIKPSINYMCINRLFDDVQHIEKWNDEDDKMLEKVKQFITDLSLATEQLKNSVNL